MARPGTAPRKSLASGPISCSSVAVCTARAVLLLLLPGRALPAVRALLLLLLCCCCCCAAVLLLLLLRPCRRAADCVRSRSDATRIVDARDRRPDDAGGPPW